MTLNRCSAPLLRCMRSAAPGVSRASLAAPLCLARCGFAAPTVVCRTTLNRNAAETLRNSPGNSPDTVTGDASASTTVVQKLFSLQRFHASSKQDLALTLQMAREAWDLLQSIPDAEVDQLSTRDLAEIVNSYNYFARYWLHGMEGPGKAGVSGFASPPSDAASAAAAALRDGVAGTGAPLSYPIVDRQSPDASFSRGASCAMSPLQAHSFDKHTPPKRANPLDEILDF